MTFVRRSLLALCAAVVLAVPAPLPLAAQTSAAPSAASTPPTTAPTTAAPAPTENQPAYTLPPDKLAKAIALNRIRDILAIVGSLWGIAALWLLLATRAAAGLEEWAQRIARRRWVQGLVFFSVFLVIITLASVPLDWIGQYFSRAYGISVQGWGSWLGDEAKSLVLSLLIGVPVLLLFNRIVRRWPRRYWFGIWLVTLPLLVLSVFVSPFLEPIFNKFQPLVKTNPALVQQLEKVVARTGTHIPPSRMFLMKASAKTTGLNAYVSGIGSTKRIVVWDTTADHVPTDEILFIFAHETGHYVLHHIPKEIALTAVGLFFVYWACAGFGDWLALRFGARWRLSSPEDTTPLASRAGFVVLLLAISIAGFLLEPASNGMSRYFEHQADIYGQEAIHGIVSNPQKTAVAAFDALGQAWLEDPHPNPFIEFWLFDHPSVQQRANFAAYYNPWANGGHGRYFSH